MRSEKEIVDRIKLHVVNQGKNTIADLALLAKEEELGWTLGGKPRYSVTELKKLFLLLRHKSYDDDKEFGKSEWSHMHDWGTLDFLDFLKDKKKVEEVLNEK